MSPRDSRGCTPLHAMVREAMVMKKEENSTQDDGKIVELLINFGADVNEKDVDDTTALHMAVTEGNMEIIKILVKRGANLESKSKLKGSTPLHCAANSNKLEAARELLSFGAQVDEVNEVGDTALLIASLGNNVELVKLLLDSGADAKKKNLDNVTPAYKAAVGGCDAIMRALAECGADINDKGLGVAPIHLGI